MKKQETIERIRETGIVPVVRTASVDEALRVVEAIVLGGIDVLEITMTIPNPLRAIEEVCARYGERAIVGAGSVLDAETARACISAGARFVVSPVLNVGVVELCRRYSVPVLPGGLTPTEVLTAWVAGADMVKVFPCDAVGGASYLKSLKAPLPHIELIPTGGITLATAADFIRAGALALGVGSDLVDLKAIRADQPEKISDAARAYVAAVRAAREEQVTTS